MPKAEGFFNYRPDVITDLGQKKPSGFTGNKLTGEIPIAIWDAPHNAYRMLEGVDAQTHTTRVAPVGYGSTPAAAVAGNNGDTTKYETPKEGDKMGMMGYIILPLVVLVAIFVLMRRK